MKHEIVFKQGEFETASSIMTEAAQWLAANKQPLWTEALLKPDYLRSHYHADEVVVGYSNDIPVVTALLQWNDPLFWPGKTDSGIIHKLAVRRAYAGHNYPNELLQWAAKICLINGKRYLRLDCDSRREKLRAFYESLNFRSVGSVELGAYHGTLYELDLGNPA